MALTAAAALTFLNIAAMPSAAFLIPRATNTSRVSIPLNNIGNQAYTAGVKMGDSQQFVFGLDLNTGYTIVAGPNCQNCVTNSSLPSYNPSQSSTFVQQSSGGAAANIQTTLSGKPISGALGTENCALHKADGTWWNYPNQTVIVAGSDSDSQALGPASGVAGFGQTNVQSADQSLVGQYLAGHTDISSISFGLALNPLSDPSAGSDSSGGTLHIFQPDSSFYSGSMVTLPVANSNQQSNFGSTPPQIGSYDWTVQMQGWSFVPSQNQQAITGGGGVYVTVEASYPYIVLTAADAQKIYSAIPGSQPYTIPANAVTSSGVAVAQDSSTQSYSIPCSSSGFSLTANFGDGVAIPINPSDLYTNIGGVCVGNVKGWADASRGTYVFGSAFLRNAYIVITANPNQQSNTIGLATRAFQTKSSKSNVGAIVGGVIGGLVFIALIALASFFFIRHRRRQNEIPPSAAFATSGDLSGGGSSEKHHSLLGFMSKDRNADNLAAEPWTPPPATASAEGGHQNGGNVVVQPWSPNAPAEQAFLSPTGATAFPAAAGAASTSPGPTSTSFGGHTPPPASTSPAYTAHSGAAQPMTPPPRSPGMAYDQPVNGSSYSPVPNPTGQAMWVERR